MLEDGWKGRFSAQIQRPGDGASSLIARAIALLAAQ